MDVLPYMKLIKVPQSTGFEQYNININIITVENTVGQCHCTIQPVK